MTIQDTLHKSAHHYAKKNQKTEVTDFLFNEYQFLKEKNKVQNESRQENSNVEDRGSNLKKKTKREANNNIPTKAMYRLYRSDNLGNANEVGLA